MLDSVFDRESCSNTILSYYYYQIGDYGSHNFEHTVVTVFGESLPAKSPQFEQLEFVGSFHN